MVGTEAPPKAAPPPRPQPPPPTPPSTIQYAYMFEPNKSPTKQLDALLRAISRYICRELGDKNDHHLTPPKLAAFYKAVGGDYDCTSARSSRSTATRTARMLTHP
jgi:hypothetical protein